MQLRNTLPLIRSTFFSLEYNCCWVASKGLPRSYEEVHPEVSGISLLGEELFAAYHFELRQRFAAISRLSHTARIGTSGPCFNRSQNHPRICRASARSVARKKLHRAKARHASFVFQILRAGRHAERKSGAPRADAETPQAHSFGTLCRGNERLLEPGRGDEIRIRRQRCAPRSSQQGRTETAARQRRRRRNTHQT